jgi:hypothetical protein
VYGSGDKILTIPDISLKAANENTKILYLISSYVLQKQELYIYIHVCVGPEALAGIG